MSELREKTIKDVDLPAECKKDFIKLFKATECMDLYDGDLEKYIGVILAAFVQQKSKIESANFAFERFRDILNDYQINK